MSNPQNKLDQYRSHSYHFVMVAANNTEAIKNLIDPKVGQSTNFLAAVQGVRLGQELYKDSGAYLVCDTRRISEFMIDNVKFTTYVGGNSSPSDHTSILGTLSMQIIDPSGIGFFNYMKWLCDIGLQTDITGVTFLLHVMFMGHTDSGTTELVDSISIPLIMAGQFNLTQFGTDGGRYELQFVPISGMIGDDFAIYTNLWAGESISIKFSDGLLGNAIQALENKLNKASREYFFKMNPIEKPTDGVVTESQVQSKNPQAKKHKNGRLVQYMITIPEHWFYFKVDSPAAKLYETKFESVKAQKQQQVEKQKAEVIASVNDQTAKEPKTPATGYYASAANMTIPDVLWALLTACDEVNKLCNLEAKSQGIGKIFKVLTGITSDKDIVLVHFDIVEFNLPDTNGSESDVIDSRVPTKTENPPGAMIFDYVFSGKNEDILHLDIAVNNLMMGLFSKSNVSVSAIQDIVGKSQVKNKDEPEVFDKPMLYKVRQLQPIVAPPPSYIQYTNNAVSTNKGQANPAKNFQNKQEFHRSLSDLAAANLQPVVKIRGNPDIFKSFVIDSIAPHVNLTESIQTYLNNETIDFNKLTAWDYSRGDTKTRKTPTAKGGATIVAAHLEHRKWVKELIKPVQDQLNSKYKAFIAGGMYVKINIFGPADYPFAEMNAGDTYNPLNNSIRTQLFYDGWYFVSAVHNEFSSSSFTQDLQLHTCDLYGEYMYNQQENKLANS
jgi:hypothetical protein